MPGPVICSTRATYAGLTSLHCTATRTKSHITCPLAMARCILALALLALAAATVCMLFTVALSRSGALSQNVH